MAQNTRTMSRMVRYENGNVVALDENGDTFYRGNIASDRESVQELIDVLVKEHRENNPEQLLPLFEVNSADTSAAQQVDQARFLRETPEESAKRLAARKGAGVVPAAKK